MFEGIGIKINNDWLKRFLQRFPDISLRKRLPRNISEHEKFDAEAAKRYIEDLDDLTNRGYLKDPRLMCNADESLCQLFDNIIKATLGLNKDVNYSDQPRNPCKYNNNFTEINNFFKFSSLVNGYTYFI